MALGLGSNLGSRQEMLRFAVDSLAGVLRQIRCSSQYETEAVSAILQPPFLNTALVGLTRLEPDDLLAVAKKIELAAGRRSGPRWGPRPLDIDLLLFGDRVIDEPAVTVPHPRLAERLFYLRPLFEIAPGLRVPPGGATIGELLAALEGR
ncbi:MAG: 2-amino-4-hydroxy-6-hydroxymethyldihydropteridine diphosphokinase [Acidobacteriota bacterium]|nr:2-amino-4-hydroxy-6-hydroxymethyldihydropteridine diphosphokinase [Acidobacteriota bacterium]